MENPIYYRLIDMHGAVLGFEMLRGDQVDFYHCDACEWRKQRPLHVDSKVLLSTPPVGIGYTEKLK